MKLSTLANTDIKGKIVLLRTDYNVPVINGSITDEFRIDASLKTIKYLIDNDAKVLIMTHRGRPKGEPDEAFSLKILLGKLSEKLGKEVSFIENVNEPGLKERIDNADPGSVFLFENMRFYKGEKKNDGELAKKFAALGHVYINDGFAVCHREHMSVHALPRIMESRCAGYLLENEVKNLEKLTTEPSSPYVFIVGGSKVSTKLDVLNNTIKYADTILIGGGLAFTFLKAYGFDIGKSLLEEDMIEHCRDIFKQAKEHSTNIVLPIDVIAAKSLDDKAPEEKSRSNMLSDDIGLDIGPMTVEIFKGAIKTAKTIAWNGPMGMFENPLYIKGTIDIAKAVHESTASGAFSVAGGGDSVAALNQLGHEDAVSFISTGGGAMLEMLSGIELPGINVLKEA